MCPVFSLGGVELQAYALFTVVGAAAACLLALPALKRAGLTAARSGAALLMMGVSFLVGARLWNYAVNPGNYLGPLRWYTPKLAGLSLYGGVVGAAVALALAAKGWKKPLLPLLDSMVIPGGVAFCLARVGCFLNGCCGGKDTGGPFGVVFPDRHPGEETFSVLLPFLKDRPVHPTQLYELAGAAMGLLAVLLICSRIHGKPGTRCMLYLAVFSGVRLAVLPFRALSYPGLVKDVLYPLLYAGLLVFGVVWTVRRNRLGSAPR